MNENKAAVFLSYASQDAAVAQRVREALQAAGIEVWFDQKELRGGEAWDQKIRRQIRECTLFVPLISNRTQERLEGYFRREWKLAVDRTQDMAEEKVFIMPVAIDDTPDTTASVPDKFRAVQWLRVGTGESLATLVERVRRLLDGESNLGPLCSSAIHLQAREFLRRQQTQFLAVVCLQEIAGSAPAATSAGETGPAAEPRFQVIAREVLAGFMPGEFIGAERRGCYFAFTQSVTAVRFALRLHGAWRKLSKEGEEAVVGWVGLHAAEVAPEDAAGGRRPAVTAGSVIDRAAEVGSLGRPGQVLLTRRVFDDARQVLRSQDWESGRSLSWVSHGHYHLGWDDEPTEVCEVAEVLAGALTPPGGTKGGRRAGPVDHEPVLGWRPALGQLVPDTLWVLEQKLGEGGFGEVWLGRHQTMKERRVFKFCFHAERARSLKRELTLFRVLKERVGDHPNIVRLLEVHFNEPPIYLEMDHVDGPSLRPWCEQQGGVEKIPLKDRCEIVAQIAEALQAAHDAGVIHRDVKPGNILVAHAATPGAPPRAKLSDFGIGQVVSEEVLQGVTKAGFTQSVLAESSTAYSGTQLYMAPELFAGGHASPQSDLYSLGVVLFQLVVGDLRRPVTTDWARAIEDPLLREDLARCFAGKPEERFRRAGELAERLRAREQRRDTLARAEAAAAARRQAARRWKLAGMAALATVVVGLAASTAWFLQRSAKIRWARETALPEVNRLIEKLDYFAAYDLAVQVEKFLPTDPALTGLWPKISARANIDTSPPGADIYYKEYRRPESEWRHLGKAPVKDVRMARVFYRWQFRKEGYAIAERAYGIGGTLGARLSGESTTPSEMVPIWLDETDRVSIASYTGLPFQPLGVFLIDRREVSNRQYKAFVDAGGYVDRKYWEQAFQKEGKALTWEEALAAFRDSTGRPGPSTWVNGTYPEGKADYPVTGVSWFEAAAYAEFVGKRLPSIYHWRRATWIAGTASIVPLSNFGEQGMAPCGQYQGMAQYGVYDLAGNAKEWCWNEATPGTRYIFGGGWSEPEYMFLGADMQSPFNRGELYGFRCIKFFPDTPPLIPEVDAPFVRKTRNYASEQPVSDEEFRSYRNLYAYDKASLDSRVERAEESTDGFRFERVSYNTAYNQERMEAMIWLPKKGAPPFQIVIFFPGAGAMSTPSSAKVGIGGATKLVLENGRALVFPIYKGTYERGQPPWKSPSGTTIAYRDWMVQLSQDLGRTIDYLETRTDMRSGKLAFLGYSWGGRLGGLLPAVEPRLKASVLLCGGFPWFRQRAEADPINFAPRVTLPTLMVNGRHDYAFPLETMQLPMFRLLGTPPEHKRHLLLDSGHAPPIDQCGRDILEWLDKYLGPVGK